MAADVAREGAPLSWPYPGLELGACSLVLASSVIASAWHLYFDVQRRLNPYIAHRLCAGYFGLRMDCSDHQWRGFAENIPMAASLVIAHVLVGRALRGFRVRPPCFIGWETAFGLAVFTALHGAGTLVLLTLVSLNFALSRLTTLSSRQGVVVRLVPLLAWLFAVATLLSRDRLGRFRFASMGLAPLDQFPGVRNWTVGFPFVALRMVSFAVDHHDALTGAALPPPAPKVSSDTYRRLQDTSRPPDRYSFVNYLGFVFYAPLAVAGPICSFNAWHAQMEAPHPTPPRDLLLYTGRLLFAYVCLIAVLHVSYVTAIVDTATHGFPDLFKLVSGMEFVMFSFCIFMFTWLKLLVIWRFFRLWALLAGVYTVENMTRCVLNNYSALDFWRSWHCSFNVWILRYLYVPLGGNRWRLLNTFVAFTFVAVWHDLDWRLVHWAWGVVAIVVPELLVLRIVSGPRLLRLRSQWFYRPLCITAMAANASLLILANSAGFFFFGPSLQVLAASWWSGVSLGAALWYGAFLWALMDIALYVRR